MIGAAVVAVAGIAVIAYVTLYAPTSPERPAANRTRGVIDPEIAARAAAGTNRVRAL